MIIHMKQPMKEWLGSDMECKQLGYIEHGTGKHQSNTVYSPSGVSPTITTLQGGGTQQIKIMVVEDD